MNRFQYGITAGSLAIFLVGCAHSPVEVSMDTFSARAELASERANSVAQQEREFDPVSAPSALTGDLLAFNSAPVQEVRFDIEANGRAAKQFFADLGRSQNINILVDPLVTDDISLSLRNVTLNQVISALRDLYGFDFQRTNYGYRVMPNQLSTRVYHLNYLNVERSGVSKTQVGGDDSNTVTTNFSTNSGGSESNFWAGIQQSISGLIKSRGDQPPVVINEETGLLVVSATSSEHQTVANFLRDAELIMQKQVIIEAKIVEVTLDQQFRSGINWNVFSDDFAGAGDVASIGLGGNALAGAGDAGGIFNFSLDLGNFTSMLQLLDHQGDVQVLSSPRVSTVNNQKAVIKVGTDEFFATVSSVATGEDGELTPSFELEQFFSGIALDVTPQIADSNSVVLHVRPTVTDVVERTKVINIANENYSLPLAYSNIRESDSIIRAQSGQIVVIGGLLQRKQDLASTGLPWFGKVPLLGKLFSQDRESNQKSELVILLKPTVYDEYTALEDFDDMLNRLD